MLQVAKGDRPMNPLRETIQQYREEGHDALLHEYRFKHNGRYEWGKSFDSNYWKRRDLLFELYNEVSPKDKALLRWLIDQEIEGALEAMLPPYLMDVAAFLLYKVMDKEDIDALYAAKFAGGTDHHVYLDVELLFGHDREQMKAFLTANQEQQPLYAEILKTIGSYEANPNATFKSRADYVNYFETRKITIIKNDLESTAKYYK